MPPYNDGPFGYLQIRGLASLDILLHHPGTLQTCVGDSFTKGTRHPFCAQGSQSWQSPYSPGVALLVSFLPPGYSSPSWKGHLIRHLTLCTRQHVLPPASRPSISNWPTVSPTLPTPHFHLGTTRPREGHGCSQGCWPRAQVSRLPS